ncbi:TLC domain [Seminavis robusta]|uniref:TLC domain n=1 Tax=Seminavis robusta TaxID=568900 RepID=A0A9N8E7N5_9STRA|nr:TLC domain [Seminavis robusta]|eukprot:Sro584_g170750.1 TLC domain (273) ;mRNA; r:7641-8459
MVATTQELTVVFATAMVVFASIFEVSSRILQSLLWTTNNPGVALEKKHIPTLIRQGPSYIVSLVHCVVNGYRGIVGLVALHHASPAVKLVSPPALVEYERHIHHVEVSNTIFFAYLVFDLFHMLRLYPKLGGMDMVVHHLVFLTCSIINGSYEILPYPFCWLIVGEISTTFLDIRWALIKTGRGGTNMFQLVQYLFALTFFLTRVVVYWLGVVELFHQRSVLMDIVWSGHVPGVFMGTTLLFIGAGSVLNLVWFQKIVAMALSSKQQQPKTA